MKKDSAGAAAEGRGVESPFPKVIGSLMHLDRGRRS